VMLCPSFWVGLQLQVRFAVILTVPEHFVASPSPLPSVYHTDALYLDPGSNLSTLGGVVWKSIFYKVMHLIHCKCFSSTGSANDETFLAH